MYSWSQIINYKWNLQYSQYLKKLLFYSYRMCDRVACNCTVWYKKIHKSMYLRSAWPCIIQCSIRIVLLKRVLSAIEFMQISDSILTKFLIFKENFQERGYYLKWLSNTEQSKSCFVWTALIITLIELNHSLQVLKTPFIWSLHAYWLRVKKAIIRNDLYMIASLSGHSNPCWTVFF